LSVVSRAGFSEVALPSAEVGSISYRENIDAQRFTKIPGLTKYTPVVLRRGVTESRDLYNWYRLVNDDILLGATAQELSGDAIKPPQAATDFRKEVIINVHDREGEAVKQWILFNAWPIAYKGGESLNASADDGKLVEEVTLEYEYFLELEGGLDGFAKELAKDFIEEGATNLLATGSLPGLF
jgi:phage tail-like protein